MSFYILNLDIMPKGARMVSLRFSSNMLMLHNQQKKALVKHKLQVCHGRLTAVILDIPV